MATFCDLCKRDISNEFGGHLLKKPASSCRNMHPYIIICKDCYPKLCNCLISWAEDPEAFIKAQKLTREEENPA